MPRGGVAARGPPVGVLRSAAHRRAESRFWGVFIIAVHRAFVLGLGAQHRGIVELSQSVFRCVTVFACYSSFLLLTSGPSVDVSFTASCAASTGRVPGLGGAFIASTPCFCLCWYWGPT